MCNPRNCAPGEIFRSSCYDRLFAQNRHACALCSPVPFARGHVFLCARHVFLCVGHVFLGTSFLCAGHVFLCVGHVFSMRRRMRPPCGHLSFFHAVHACGYV